MPAQEGLKPRNLLGLQIYQRLEVELELLGDQGAAQVDFEGAPRLHLRVHVRLEETIPASTVALGTVERHIRILEHLVGVVSIGGGNRDPHARADHDLMLLYFIRAR